jgi:NADH-quinone oxidoreductase subunit G
MPHLIIDNMTVEVPVGTRVIEAAEQLGIMIPRFCYLKILGAVGACRMCAVHFVEGPVKGVEMSCMVEAEDDMVISTSDSEAADFRRQVIEWLMINHPHDCPVCDEGGQCLLQDETVSGGHSIRRYPGCKRTYRDQYLGPFIQHEMNRCIHCYRCARFYQEYAGYRDFGVLQIGNRVFYGRFEDGPLESPFAGNLVDICPTGVFTDKPARYRARRWDMQRSPSVCLNCSIGCNTVASGFHQEIIRQEARENREVNGSFICDRGRFGSFYASHPHRPRRPRVGDKEVDWDRALADAAAAVQKTVAGSGPQSLAFLGSIRSSLETICMLEQASHRLGAEQPQYFTDPMLEYRVGRATARLDQQLSISLAKIEYGDCILLVGVDPINEAPMLALALRQATRRGAAVTVIDPRPVSLPFEFSLLSVSPAEIPVICGLLLHQALEGQSTQLDEKARHFYDSLASRKTFDADYTDKAGEMAGKIEECRRPVIICGTGIVQNSLPDFAANTARLLYEAKGNCGLYYVFPGPNAFGALLFNKVGRKGFTDLLEAIEKEEIKACIAVETDPFHSFCDRQRLDKALAKLELLICLDFLPTELSRRAHILCPTTTHFETASSFVNQEGRIQHVVPVHHCGRPLSQASDGKHPPRDFVFTGGRYEPRPAWQILQDLGDLAGGKGGETNQRYSEEPQEIGALLRQRLQQLGYPAAGDRLLQENRAGEYHSAPAGRPVPDRDKNVMELILTEQLYGTEELSLYSGPAAEVISEPLVIMHSDDAMHAGFKRGDMVTLHLDRGVVRLRLEILNNMARGCLVLPRHRDLDWQQQKYRQELLPLCRIEKG